MWKQLMILLIAIHILLYTYMLPEITIARILLTWLCTLLALISIMSYNDKNYIGIICTTTTNEILFKWKLLENTN